MKNRHLLLLVMIFAASLPFQAQAEVPPEKAVSLSEAQRMSLAREFLSRVKRGFVNADTKWERKHETNADKARRLPEGEDILLNIRLERKILLDTSILGRAEDGLILLSLRDFVLATNFPIDINIETGEASGWYIREKRRFDLDAKSRTVQSFAGQFQMSENVKVEQDDIFVPIDELASWFGFKLDLNVNALEIALDSPTPLPIQEKLAREGFERNNYRVGPPQLPLKKEDPAAIDVPFLDVSTRSSYEKKGEEGESSTKAMATARTTNDFAYGTLTTQSTFEKDEYLTNVRATYKRASLDKEFLGPLQARRYEIGDVTPVSMELRTVAAQGLGFRATDAHPLRNTLRPSTTITGTSFPGWDVELYRDDQLLAYQTVGDDGVYTFDNVDLYSDENNFRVVFYGLQGEVNEEEVSIPVDMSRLAEMGAAYDIMVSAQNTQTYRKMDLNDNDQGAPNVAGVYEFPVGEATIANVGFETGQDGGRQEYVGHAGLSTTIGGILFNLDTAADQDGEGAAQLVGRREIKKHQIRNEMKISTDKFGVSSDVLNDDDAGSVDIFTERLSLNGPFPFEIGRGTRYNLSLGYYQQADDDKRVETVAGLSTNIAGMNFGQQFVHSSNDIAEDTLNSKTTVSGNIGRNRLRLISDYQMKPESKLQQVTAQYNRNLTRKLEFSFDASHKPDPKLSEVAAKLNWDAGFANISPGLSYNTDKDFAATLNTRFGLASNPHDGSTKFFDRQITSNGGVSAFVFLDKNGDNIFNEEDEPLPDVVVKAPQNGGNMETDEKGYAFFARLGALRPTDVYVDPDSLPDPFWISGFEGVSIIPREGHVTTLEFPIHMSGEMDGTVYVRDDESQSYPLRGIPLSLYDMKGKKIQSTISESDGFYLFERVPPGKYYLTVDGENFKNRMARPKPEEITFGYEGTTIYGRNIYIQENETDVPIAFSNNSGGLDMEDPADREIIFNMGSYNSRLMMGLAWFKVKAFLGSDLKSLRLLDKPSESYPDPKTGKYDLRLVSKKYDLDYAYNLCKELNARSNQCGLSIVIMDPSQVASRQ